MVQNGVDVDDDPILLRLLDRREVLLLGSPFRPLAALDIELSEVVEVLSEEFAGQLQQVPARR